MPTTYQPATVQEAHHYLATIIAEDFGDTVVIPALALGLGTLLPENGVVIADNATRKFGATSPYYDYAVMYSPDIECFIALRRIYVAALKRR